MTPTRQIKSSEFAAGQIVHFYGARFRLRDDVKQHPERDEPGMPVFTATGDWIDGTIEHGYFGPSQPWKFQGNDRATWLVEA